MAIRDICELSIFATYLINLSNSAIYQSIGVNIAGAGTRILAL